MKYTWEKRDIWAGRQIVDPRNPNMDCQILRFAHIPKSDPKKEFCFSNGGFVFNVLTPMEQLEMAEYLTCFGYYPADNEELPRITSYSR